MTRADKLEARYKAALALSQTFLQDVNYAQSALNAEDIVALNNFYFALKEVEKSK